MNRYRLPKYRVVKLLVYIRWKESSKVTVGTHEASVLIRTVYFDLKKQEARSQFHIYSGTSVARTPLGQ